MRRKLIECVANFSEGRDVKVISGICDSIGRSPDVAVLDTTADPDHHRSVITFAGSPHAVVAAAVRAVAKAAELIDLRKHSGVHPRLGAADVIPLVPVENVALEECTEMAHRLGEEIWRTAGVPVYFYEAAARIPERVLLENVRRGGWEVVREASLHDPRRQPDIGGPGLHPTAGAAIVGARKFLVAWNVNLTTADVSAARAIARKIRASSGGLPHVKALGLLLNSRNQAQVSMNLTDFEATPLSSVYRAILEEAAKLGVSVAGGEIIGLLPRAVLEDAAATGLRWENFSSDVVLEHRIHQELPFS